MPRRKHLTRGHTGADGIPTCPMCGRQEVSEHSGCLSPVVGAVLLVVVMGGSGALGGAVAAIGLLVALFVLAGTIAAGFSALFGRHKCKACGEKWR